MKRGRPVHILSDTSLEHGRRVRFCWPALAGVLLWAWSAGTVAAQPAEFTVDDKGAFVATDEPEPTGDAAVMLQARRLLADGKASTAKSILTDWLDEHEQSESPYIPEAYYLRGEARTATDAEFWALYDYEAIIKGFPGSPFFPKAVEREFEIAKRYLNGLRTKFLWMRIEDASELGEELMVRSAERMPGSRLAEVAHMELADFYFRSRDLRMASEAYDLFVKNFPRSELRPKAMERRIFANIARFKGPEYDISGLIESRYLIRDFAERYPAAAQRTGIDDALVARLDESSAAHMLGVAKWYLRRDDPVSARFTISRLIRKHPQTAAAAEGQRMMTEKGWTLPPKPEPPIPAADGGQAEPSK